MRIYCFCINFVVDKIMKETKKWITSRLNCNLPLIHYVDRLQRALFSASVGKADCRRPNIEHCCNFILINNKFTMQSPKDFTFGFENLDSTLLICKIH